MWSGLEREYVPAHEAYEWVNAERTPQNDVIIQVTLHGELLLSSATGDTWLRGPGQGFICYTGDDLSYRRAQPGPYVCAYVRLRGAGMASHAQEIRSLWGPCFDDSHNLIADKIRFLQRQGEHVAACDEARHVHALVMELYQLGEYQGSGVRAACERLHAAPFRDWSLASLAAAHDCSREHFTRVFTQRYGQSPAQYLRERRMQQAEELLTSTDLDVAHIAQRCSLGTAHTLARLLRQRHGVGPQAFRQ